MQASLLCCLVLVAAAAVVMSKHCAHTDVSTCHNMTCNTAGEGVICEKDICTCAPTSSSMTCTQRDDCLSYTACQHKADHVECTDGLCHHCH